MSTHIVLIDGQPLVVLEEDMLQQGWVRKEEANKRIRELERRIENLDMVNEELQSETVQLRRQLLKGISNDPPGFAYHEF